MSETADRPTIEDYLTKMGNQVQKLHEIEDLPAVLQISMMNCVLDYLSPWELRQICRRLRSGMITTINDTPTAQEHEDVEEINADFAAFAEYLASLRTVKGFLDDSGQP